MKSDEELKKDGFTTTGIQRYQGTIREYENSLYEKSLKFGDAHKAQDLPTEITHAHVKSAASSIANSYGDSKLSGGQIMAQVLEYILTAVSAFALAKLNTNWGMPVFVITAIITALLVFTRLLRPNSK